MRAYQSKKMASINKRLRYAISCAIILFGCVLLYAVFQITTRVDIQKISKEADNVMTFLQSSCQKYDDYKLGNTIEELQTIMLQTTMLKRYLENNSLTDEKQLEAFLDDQYLTGICLLDDQLNVQYSVNKDDTDNSVLLEQIMSETNIANVLLYPQKRYSEQVKLGDRYFDYVIAARDDTKGVMICYRDVTVSDEDMNEFSLNSLLSGDSFYKNAAIVITDGESVLCSNVADVNGIAVKDCPLTDIGQYASKNQHNIEHGMIVLQNDDGKWYGKHELYRNYYLYTFYSSEDVFSDRNLVLVLVTSIYVVMCVVLVIILQYIQKRKFQREEKEYHLIKVIASIYTANCSIYPDENTWKPIVISERMEKVVGHIPQADKMLDTFNKKRVAPGCQENFAAFVNLNDLKERLENQKFIGYTFEDVEGLWYQLLFIPQESEYEMSQYRVMFVIRNVTEQRRAEMDYQEKLRVTAEEARRANEAKTDFLKRMSHDIRTPINGIAGMVTVAKTCLTDQEKIEECLDKIKDSTDLLIDLMNNVLDMSKLESGDVVLAEKPFDLVKLLEAIDIFIRARAEEKDVVLNIKPLNVVHSHLVGSVLHIRQIIQNITSNAIKFNHQNGLVTVGCTELSCDGEEAVMEFTCADTGTGMSAEFQKKAFDLFAQESEADNARTVYTGTGLGLAIAKKLVDYMHGHISFTSEQGKGTEFRVVLKLKIDQDYYEQAKDTAKNEEMEAEDVSQKSIQGLQVLVVEDNELNMEIAQYLLEDQGALVTKAWNGKEALDIFESSKEGTFDMILMDIMMPVMDGLEATRCIRALERTDAKTVPIIAMSANAFDDDISRSLDAGMNTHLAKPLEFDKLFEAMVELKM